MKRNYRLIGPIILAILLASGSVVSASFTLSCSCGCQPDLPGQYGLETCRHYSAQDILNAITAGSMIVNLPAVSDGYMPQPLQGLQEGIPLQSHDEVQGIVFSKGLGEEQKKEIDRLTGLPEAVTQIIPATTLASLYQHQADHLTTNILEMNAYTMGSAMQMAMLHYLILTGTNSAAYHQEIDRAIRLWLLFKFWLHHIAAGTTQDINLQHWLSQAMQEITPVNIPDTQQLLQQMNESRQVLPSTPGQFNSIIQTLLERIRALSRCQYALLRIPFFGANRRMGVLAVYIGESGTVFLITPNNNIIEVSEPDTNLQQVLETLLAPAIALATQPVPPPPPLSVRQRFVAPSLTDLSFRDLIYSETIVIVGFGVGCFLGQKIANQLSLSMGTRSALITISGLAGAILALGNTPVGAVVSEQIMTNIANWVLDQGQ